MNFCLKKERCEALLFSFTEEIKKKPRGKPAVMVSSFSTLQNISGLHGHNLLLLGSQ